MGSKRQAKLSEGCPQRGCTHLHEVAGAEGGKVLFGVGFGGGVEVGEAAAPGFGEGDEVGEGVVEGGGGRGETTWTMQNPDGAGSLALFRWREGGESAMFPPLPGDEP